MPCPCVGEDVDPAPTLERRFGEALTVFGRMVCGGYEAKGVSEKEVERRAWATVNKDDGGGKKQGGSGRGKSTGHPAAHKGGKAGGKASAHRSAADRSASAKKAAATRKRNAEHHAHN